MAEVSRNLNVEEEKLFFRLRGQIQNKARRNRLRLEYHDMKQHVELSGFSIPEHFRDVKAALNWPFQSCSSVSQRINFLGYTLTHESSLLDELDEATFDGAVASVSRLAVDAMASRSVSFVFITPGIEEKFEPPVIVTACTASEATAERDKRTRRVTAALETVSKTEYLMYMDGLTLRIEALNRGKWTVTYEYVGVPGLVMCVPFVWHETLDRPFGYSRITRAVMDITDRFFRSSIREEVQADLFSVPRMAMTNADESAFYDDKGNRISPLKAMMGAVWGIPAWRDDETGDLVEPTLQQFAQASFEPHQAMRRGLAMEFSGETKIPIGQLGIVQDNPSSADAIRANEYGLIGLITAEIPGLEESLEDMARKIVATQQGKWDLAMAKDLRKLRAQFADPATPTKSAQADAGAKTLGALPDLVGSGIDLEIMNLTPAQIERAKAHRLKVGSGDLIDKLLGATPAGAVSDPAKNAELEAALVVKAQADTLGVLRRAGVERNDAALRSGFVGSLKFIEGEPITIKTKDE